MITTQEPANRSRHWTHRSRSRSRFRGIARRCPFPGGCAPHGNGQRIRQDAAIYLPLPKTGLHAQGLAPDDDDSEEVDNICVGVTCLRADQCISSIRRQVRRSAKAANSEASQRPTMASSESWRGSQGWLASSVRKGRYRQLWPSPPRRTMIMRVLLVLDPHLDELRATPRDTASP
jgi:hypothetical protein